MPPFPHLIRCLSAYVVPTLWRGNEENEHVAEGPIDEETIRFLFSEMIRETESPVTRISKTHRLNIKYA